MPQEDHQGDVEAALVLLTEQLCGIYDDYLGKSQVPPPPVKRVTRLFRGWLSGANPLVADPVHQAFLDGIAHTLDDLRQVLEKRMLDAPETCNVYAAKAAQRMLMSRPGNPQTAVEWYIIAAGHQCAEILPYLSAEDLRRIRNDFLRQTPKRMMYPNERKLLAKMDECMAQKNGKA